MPLAEPSRVRVLEARFYPERRSSPRFVIVGHLVWRDRQHDDNPAFQPVRSATSAPIAAKLSYLLNAAKPDCFNQLQSLRSDFWAFVEIPGRRESWLARVTEGR
jgi:hypothetical protein